MSEKKITNGSGNDSDQKMTIFKQPENLVVPAAIEDSSDQLVFPKIITNNKRLLSSNTNQNSGAVEIYDSKNLKNIPRETLQHGATILNREKALETQGLILSSSLTSGSEKTFTIGMVNPEDQPSLQKIADEVEVPWRKIHLVKLEQDDFINLFEATYGIDLTDLQSKNDGTGEKKWHELVEFRKDDPTEKKSKKNETQRTSTLGEEKARTEKEFAQQIMRSALQLGASDIHLDMGPTSGMVRLRIDGVLYNTIRTPSGLVDMSDIDNEYLLKVCGAIGANANVNYEDMLNKPQDGSLVLHYKNHNKETLETRLRFASLPRKIENGNQRGSKVTLRLNQKMITDINELGLEPEVIEIIKKGLQYIGGIGFIVGGTGSGKTNILASCHTILRKGYGKNVMEFADTIEQMFDGMCQTETDVNCSEGDIIKSYLRHDPDAIIASEVRDREATSKLVEIATAGKLVLSTLHANSLPGVFIRLEKLGIDRYTQSETLRFVVFTTLVRKLCPKCKVKGFRLRGLSDEVYEYVASEKGCAYCRFVGYRGRTSISEAMTVTPRIAELIAEGKSGAEICRIAEEEGALFSLKESISRKIAAGITSKAEVLRVIDLEKRLSQTPKKENKTNYDWREQPSKNETDAERIPITLTSENNDFRTYGQSSAYNEENIIDLDEIGENDFAIDIEDVQEVEFDLKDSEIDSAVEILNVKENSVPENTVSTEDLLEVKNGDSIVQPFEVTKEVSVNGTH